MEIYFSNFNEETQKAILEMAGISDPKEANWDVFPITLIAAGLLLSAGFSAGVRKFDFH